MEIVLLEDVKALGKKGEIVKVNEGYARNFILPKKLGVEATAKNLNDLKLKKANQEKLAAQQLAAAKAEVNKPFEFEEELAQRNARLIELDMQLNMDMQPEKPERAEEIKEPEAEIKQPEPALALAQRARESILERLRQPLPPRPEIAARAVKTKSYAMEL